MKSKTKTAAVGIAAACAASTTPTATASPTTLSSISSTCSLGAASASATASSSTSWSLASTPSPSLLLDRIPRGGHTPPAAAEQQTTTEKKSSSGSSSTPSSSSAAKEGGEKKRKKKKKSKKTSKSSSASSAASASASSSSQSRQSHQSAPNEPSDTSTKSTSTSTSSSASSSSSSSHALPPAAASILSQTCHYSVLGITNSASQIEIQKAYRRRCVLTHPDKLPNGDRSAFDKVSEAYDVLSCEKKRAVYDRFGKEGLESGVDTNFNGMNRRRGGFGGDVFREFFGSDPFFGRRQSSTSNPGGGGASSQSSRFGNSGRPPPRNRDLRYQLEVTLEELYKGSTKHVAIQQPNPLRPHFPYRKEVEVHLPRGMRAGQSIRLSGVVDSIADAAPADVIFLVRERRHSVYTRKGCDLAIEVKISYAESIVGFERTVRCLDGKEIVIGSPFVERVVKKEELVDVPALPTTDTYDENENENENGEMIGEEDDLTLVTTLGDLIEEDNSEGTKNATAPSVVAQDEEPNNATAASQQSPSSSSTPKQPILEQITKTTTLSYHLPPSIIQTGDVHVLKGHGMPKRGSNHHHHDDDECGDLYVQYIVETPTTTGHSTSTTTTMSNSADNLTPEERVELARLLAKLEGSASDPTVGVVHTNNNITDEGEETATKDRKKMVHHLALSSASDFGSSAESDHSDNMHNHDEHLHHDNEDEHPYHGAAGGGMPHDVNEFFQRAFTGGVGRTAGGFGGPFGLGGAGGGGGFHYFSSSSGGGGGGNTNRGGFGYNGHPGEEEDHKVECNQM